MKVTVNGQEMVFCEPPTGGSLLAVLDIAPATVVAELNGEIIKREDLLNHELDDGDVLELVTVVGGG